MKNQTVIQATLIVAIMATFSCAKQESRIDTKKKETLVPAPVEQTQPKQPTVVEPVAVVNSTQLVLKKVDEKTYLVFPASQQLALSLDNSPIKPQCKAIEKLESEIKIIEAQREQILAVVAEDFAYEGAIDELEMSYSEKNNELKKLNDETLNVKVKVVKEKFLSALAKIKNENTAFEMQAAKPAAIVVKSVRADGSIIAEQAIKTESLVLNGSFEDQTKNNVLATLALRYELLCQTRAENSKVEKSKKAQLNVSFE